MSVPPQTPRNQVEITGSTVTVNWLWYLEAGEDLVVVVQDGTTKAISDPLVEGVDYSVTSGLGNNGGGTITPTGYTLTAGDIWTLSRNTLIDRENNYPASGKFQAVTVNPDFDNGIRISQDISMEAEDTIRQDPGVGTNLDRNLPQPVDRRGIVFEDSGGGNFKIVMTEGDPDAAGTSAAEAAQSAADAQVSEDNAKASEDAAGVSAAEAAESAATNNLPDIDSGDTGKILEVNTAGDGYDLAVLPGPPAFRGCLVYNGGDNPVANATIEEQPWSITVYDTDNIFDSSTNTKRLFVPSGVSKVRMSALISWEMNAAGHRGIYLYKKGSSAYPGNIGGTQEAVDASRMTIQSFTSVVIPVSAGDYFSVYIYQNSGIELDAKAGQVSNNFCMEIIE